MEGLQNPVHGIAPPPPVGQYCHFGRLAHLHILVQIFSEIEQLLYRCILHTYNTRNSLIFEQNINDQYEVSLIPFINGSKI